MKQIYKKLFTACAALLCFAASQAQNAVTSNGVKVSNIELEHSGSHLNVGMTLDMSDLHIKSNKSLQITPIVTNGNEIYQLPTVVIDGRRRSIVHKRQEVGYLEPSNTYIRRYNRTDQTTEYDIQIPYEEWMDDSSLILREEWTSCHNRPLSEELLAIATISQPQKESAASEATSTLRVLPRMAYALPSASELAQSKSCDIDIYFAVNRSNINSKFMNNAEQIEKLSKALADKNIKEIKITGYASPEGPYNFNKTLAAHRAEAVKKHISASNSTANIVVDSYPANWEEIKSKLSSSYIENWQGIVAIIDDATISAADKNNAIRKKYPVEYDFMLNTWYPKLRAADISIERNQLKMSAAEVKKSVQSNPSQLSLDDIYLIALTYEKGSKEWDELILIAVENYPQSPEARINAANVAMANGDFKQAATYLDGVPSNIPQAMNSRGILAMEEGRYQDAMQLFQAAEQAGVGEATQNIALLKQLMAAENQ